MKIQQAKQSSDIVSVIGRYVRLEKKGREFIGICPFHDDTKASLTVSPAKQIFKCFACGEGGDVVDFVSKIEGITLIEAANKLLGQEDTPAPVKRTPVEKIVLTDPTSEPPIPEQAEYAWRYNDSVWIARLPGKQIRPFIHTAKGWISKHPPIPKPKYSIGTGELIICEGEKTADALARAGFNAVTWMGGANAWHMTEWNLPNDVLMYPDNDWQGWAAMQGIALTNGITPRFIPAEGRPLHWDFADDPADEIPEAIYLDDLTEVIDPLTGDSVRWFHLQAGKWVLKDEPPKREKPKGFVPMGFETMNNKTLYYFFAHEKNKLISISASGFSKSALFDLYPDVNYWETTYPGSGNNRISIDDATCSLIEKCTNVGLFNPDKIRTRGAWMDGQRVVLHVGDRLIVNGREVEISGMQSDYTYEWRQKMNFKPGEPITSDDGAKFIDMLKLYNWERTVNAELLAGWCAIAPLCGALNWRPHVWVTGSSGTGKTKLMKDTVLPLMESICITPEGESTEAGIRQRLAGDALPVLFDEAEAESKRAQDRMEGILNLMRSSSSGKSGQVMKGGTGHIGHAFNVRSCFFFASIVYQASKKADRSRISVLGLVRNSNKMEQRDRWDEYNRRANEMITDEFISGFHARSIRLLPKILKAAEVLSRQVGNDLGDRRLGDQIGTMLAGAWMLCNDEPPTAVQALTWVQGFDWTEERDLDELNDEQQLIRKILQKRLRVDGEAHPVERTIGELIIGDDYVSEDETTGALGRIGIKVDDESVIVANNSEWIVSALKDTPWQKNHGRVLSRLEGAELLKPTYFSGGINSRAVKIPRSIIGL